MGYNFMIKMAFKIILLILLCIPIAYIQIHMIKTAAKDVIKQAKKPKIRAYNEKHYSTDEYIKIAK